jgi:hypothetical protein
LYAALAALAARAPRLRRTTAQPTLRLSREMRGRSAGLRERDRATASASRI